MDPQFLNEKIEKIMNEINEINEKWKQMKKMKKGGVIANLGNWELFWKTRLCYFSSFSFL